MSQAGSLFFAVAAAAIEFVIQIEAGCTQVIQQFMQARMLRFDQLVVFGSEALDRAIMVCHCSHLSIQECRSKTIKAPSLPMHQTVKLITLAFFCKQYPSEKQRQTPE